MSILNRALFFKNIEAQLQTDVKSAHSFFSLTATIMDWMVIFFFLNQQCSCSNNPQDGALLTLRVVNAQQRSKCELKANSPTDIRLRVLMKKATKMERSV